MSYEDWQAKIPQAPPWFLRPRGAAWLRAHGKIKDFFVARAKEAAKVSLPTYAPADALVEIGSERQIDQGLAESDASYRVRLRDAWDAWLRAGTTKGMLLQLKASGFPMGVNGAHVMQHNGRWTRINAGTDALEFGDTMSCENRMGLQGTLPSPRLKGWTLDARDQFYSRFTILFPVDYAALRPNTEVASRLNRIVAKWKPAKAHYDGATVIASGSVWGWPLARTWGSGNWGGSTIYMIPPVG